MEIFTINNITISYFIIVTSISPNERDISHNGEAMMKTKHESKMAMVRINCMSCAFQSRQLVRSLFPVVALRFTHHLPVEHAHTSQAEFASLIVAVFNDNILVAFVFRKQCIWRQCHSFRMVF